MNTPYRRSGRPIFAIVLISIAMAFLPRGRAAAADPAPARVIHVLVWDEEQPKQKEAYENFLGNAIADYLRSRPGFEVKSVKLDDPDQGITDASLDQTDVIIWWGHVRNREVNPGVGRRIVERIKAGKLSLMSLHSAHWSIPFMAAMVERTKQDVMVSIPESERGAAKIEYVNPMPGVPKPDAPLTPRVSREKDASGAEIIRVHLPGCIFPSYRADGMPSHVTTLLPDHPIAAGIPEHFDIPHTEMYNEPFHVPAPDAVIFEEKWDKGEHFRSGCLWNVGKGKVFYFRPGHEVYGVYKQEIPLKIIENAVRFLGNEK